MVLEDEVKTIYTCEICGRIWLDKKFAEFCEKQCLNETPIQISKFEIKARVRAYKKQKGMEE